MISLKLLFDYHIVTAFLSLIAAWKWGDWKNWIKYYPTILFYLAGDLLYHSLTYDHILWEINSSSLGSKASDLLHKFFFFPATLLIFLPHFPKQGLTKKLLYILFWVFIYSIWELLAYKSGYFSYHNGWNLRWSIFFNLMMFPLLLLHHKKPLYGIVGAFALAYVILQYFNVPF